MRSIYKLSTVKIATEKKPGYYADGGNLYLRVAPGGTKGWIFRFARAGKTRDAGLGPFPAVSLALARKQAEGYRQLVAAGVDPIAQRSEALKAARIQSARATTFEQCAKAFIESHEAGWKNDKHKQQWRSSLANHVFAVLGPLPVEAIDTGLVMKALGPMWTRTPETASRVRGRIESILDWAKARGYRDGENPARWRGHLDNLLPAKTKVRSVVHHAALPFRDIGAMMAKLRDETSIQARALELLILTATRTGETLGATWEEFDAAERLWVIPARRMKKGRREHRVPLSPRVVAILKEMAEIRQADLVFPGLKQGRPLSLFTLRGALQRVGYGHVTLHGFRSSFRDWAAEMTNFPRDAAELALAHAVGNKVEAAYRRGDLLEKRRMLMEEWAAHCAREPASAKVVPIHRRPAH
jgi:integrase